MVVCKESVLDSGYALPNRLHFVSLVYKAKHMLCRLARYHSNAFFMIPMVYWVFPLPLLVSILLEVGVIHLLYRHCTKAWMRRIRIHETLAKHSEYHIVLVHS